MNKLGKEPARRVIQTLELRVAALPNPRAIGKPLAGEWHGHWRWRVGDYRVVAQIHDDRVVILVITVAHRSVVYR